MEVLTLLKAMKGVDLKSILLCKSIYKTFSTVLTHAINPAAILLTWAAFPRLLLVFPDSIHPPSIFQNPDWLQNWHSILLELETGAKKIDDHKIVISDSSKEDFWYKFDTLLCEVHGVSEAAGALLLANILCINTRLILEHDDCGKVRLWSGWSRKPADGSMMRKKKIAYMMMLHPVVVERSVVGKKAACHPRTATPEEVSYLRQLRLSVPGCCHHVNWEHYCRELLQGIEAVAARPTTRNITELWSVDHSQPMGDLCVVTGVDRPAARLLATALCSSTIIVVHDNLSTVWVKDITRSGPAITDSRRTTYRILPLEEDDEGGEDSTTTTTTTTRPMTEAEMSYLKQLRWQERRPALLVAARFRGGAFFHVLKFVANFLL